MDLDLLWYRGDSVNRSGRDTGGRIDGLWILDTGYWILDTKLWRRTFSAQGRRGARSSWEMLQGHGIGASRRKAFALCCIRVAQLAVGGSKSMCLSTDAHLLYFGPAGQINKQST